MSRRSLRMAVVLGAVLLLGGCGIPQDGRYQTHGGGWDNFRAALGPVSTERDT